MARSFWLGVLLAAASVCQAQTPLFSSDELLAITIETGMNTIIRQAEKRPVVDGVLHYIGDDGERITVALTMTTRGKSRLDYCSFPPLSINLKKKDVKDTLFHGQRKLKIVTHCKNGATHERYLFQEYGIYRAFNALTDKSFRVRMLTLTYRDTEGKRKDETHAAFFIERDNEVAERLGMEQLKINEIDPIQLNARHANLFSLFQYMIGNTDWSMIKSPHGESGCCHNGKVIIPPGSTANWIVLPYDFDQAGLINTRYSTPASGLGIRSVRQRVYRGRCLNISELDHNISLFNQRREMVVEALVQPQVQGGSRKNMLGYIDVFYKTINDPKKKQREIVDDCLGRHR